MRESIPTRTVTVVIKLLHNAAITLIPFLGTVWAFFLVLKQNGPQLIDYFVLVLMWLISGLGITVGFHRLLTHQSFKPVLFVKVVLAIMGCMAVQGPPIIWVSIHRKHHEYSDETGDPHSPLIGKLRLRALQGLWHAHIGWMFQHELPNPARYSPDLIRDKWILWVNKTYFLWVFIGLAIPSIIGYVFVPSSTGLFRGLLWGGLVRIFLVQNVIWSINSLCHFSGVREFKTIENSKNIGWLSILSLGESWHNNHHAFPNSAKLGLKWWQIDIGYWLIKFLKQIKLIEGVKSPSLSMIKAKQT